MYKGSTAFGHTPEVKLFTYASCFYSPGKWGAGEFERLANKVDPEFAYKLAVWCREEGLRAASDALADIIRRPVQVDEFPGEQYDYFPELSEEEHFLQARRLSDRDTVLGSGKTPGFFIELMKTCPTDYKSAVFTALQHAFDNIPNPRGSSLLLIENHSPENWLYAAGFFLKGWNPYLYGNELKYVYSYWQDFPSVCEFISEHDLGPLNNAWGICNTLYRNHERVIFICRRDTMRGHRLVKPKRTYILDPGSTNRLSGDTMVTRTDTFMKYMDAIETRTFPWEK